MRGRLPGPPLAASERLRAQRGLRRALVRRHRLLLLLRLMRLGPRRLLWRLGGGHAAAGEVLRGALIVVGSEGAGGHRGACIGRVAGCRGATVREPGAGHHQQGWRLERQQEAGALRPRHASARHAPCSSSASATALLVLASSFLKCGWRWPSGMILSASSLSKMPHMVPSCARGIEVAWGEEGLLWWVARRRAAGGRRLTATQPSHAAAAQQRQSTFLPDRTSCSSCQVGTAYLLGG